MKLVHPDLDNQINTNILTPFEWIIESPDLFSKYVQELYRQIRGKEGAFVLSENGKEESLSKFADIIINPLSVDCNSKTILNKLYAQLSSIAFDEGNYMTTQKLLSDLQTFFLILEQQSPYILESSNSPDISTIFKAMDIRLEHNTDSFFENINQYLKVIADLLHKKLVIFINLRSFLSDHQLSMLFENARYNEIELILIENSQKTFSKETNQYIIDIDACEIF